MKQYKIVNSTDKNFEGIILPLELKGIGEEFNLLGKDLTITQIGKISVLVNKDIVITLEEQEEEKKEEEKPKLIINDTLEIFLDDKEIEIKTKCTYKELYDTLCKEWGFISRINNIPLPFEYDNKMKAFTFLDSWNFKEGSFKFLSEGSFSRKTKDGRFI